MSEPDERTCATCSCSYWDYWCGTLTLFCKGFEVPPSGPGCEEWEKKRHATGLEIAVAKMIAQIAVAGLGEADAKYIVEEAGLSWDRWKSVWKHCVEIAKAGKPIGQA